jgi:hypothetical protein
MPEALESGGIHAGKIVLVGIAIAVTVALAAAIAWLAWRAWLPADNRGAPNAAVDFKVAPPLLESAPQNDRTAYMAEKEHLLHGYQWLDRDAGIARIPIEQAMRILAQPAGDAQPAAPERRP